jgi:hypothetical protein
MILAAAADLQPFSPAELPCCLSAAVCRLVRCCRSTVGQRCHRCLPWFIDAVLIALSATFDAALTLLVTRRDASSAICTVG